MNQTLIASFLAISLVSVNVSSFAEENAPLTGMDEMQLRKLSSTERERIDRIVDRAALESQKRAISRIETLLARHRGTDREEKLLTKLGELRQQRAQLEFRIGLHSRDESSYQKSLREAVSTFDEVLRKFPRSEQVAQVLSWRAKAHADLHQNALAEKDYRTLISAHAEAPEADSARMSIAGYCSDRGDHLGALEVLEPLAAKPESPFHPFALHQMAWASFNRGEIEAAVAYCLRNVRALRTKLARDTALSSDEALLENTLLDVATFEADRVEKAAKTPRAEEILTVFRSLDPGTRLPAMALRFAKLLRAHDQSELLAEWSALSWKELDSIEVRVEIDHLVREHGSIRRDYATLFAPLPEATRRMEQGSLLEGHRRLFSKAAGEIHQMLAKNPNAAAQQVQPWIEKLGLAYQRFLEITPQSDPRYFQARLNLAEAYRALERRDQAIPLYREIVASGEWKNDAVVKSSLSSIQSMIELLEHQKILPKKIELIASDSPRKQPKLSELLSWIELHLAQTNASQSSLSLERAKILYILGRRTEALAALEALALRFSSTEDAATATALLLDSELLTKQVTVIDARIAELSKSRELLKNAEAAKAIDEASLQRDVLVLSGSGDPASKVQARDRLLARKDAPQGVRDAALIDRAKELDATGNSVEALASLQSASNPASRAPAMLLLAYATENWRTLSEISSKGCDRSNALCVQLPQWLASRNGPKNRDDVAELRRISKAIGSERLLSAISMLPRQEKLGYRDRNLLIRLVSQGWGELLPLIQWEVLPQVIAEAPRALRRSREQIRTQSPLSATQKTEAHLVHRMDVIREFENGVQAALAIPVFEIQVAALHEHAQAMQDFSDDLAVLGEIAAGARPAIQKRAEEMHGMVEQKMAELSQALKCGEDFVSKNPQLATTMKLDRAAKRRFFENASTLPDAQQALWLGWILWNAGARHAAADQWKKAAPTLTAAHQ